MTVEGGSTAFVTEAAGFLGTALARTLTGRGWRVFGLTKTLEGAERLRRVGAVPVMGDVLEPGAWQDEAAADCVFHLPPHPLCAGRVTGRRLQAIARARVSMDSHLLDALAGTATRRIMYVADTGCYGSVGARPVTEDEPPGPSTWARCMRPALDRLEGYVVAGLPIVTAFPGLLYGRSSWFRARVAGPIMSGRRVLQPAGRGPWVSPIHIEDCVGALVHLARHGKPGGRYFLVNSAPVRLNDFATTFARLANRPLRTRGVPALATRLVFGPMLAEYLAADAVFSDIRLRGTGYAFRYPTLEAGLRQVLDALDDWRSC